MSAIDVQNINSKTGSSAITIADSGDISLSASITFDTDTLYVDASNNRVGIGTTSPAQTLDVVGTIQGDSTFLLSNATTSSFLQVSTNILQFGTSSSDPVAFYADNAERMRISSAGDVQIGATAVTGGRYFDIYNTGSTATDFAITRFITQQVGSSSTTSADIIKRKNGQFGIINNDTDSAAYINFTVGSSERMRIDSAGRISIGTTSAAELMNIAASSGNGAGVEYAGNGNTLASTSFFVGQGSGSQAYLYQRANVEMIFGTNNVERMRIDNSGLVGIGTTTPGSYNAIMNDLVVAGSADSGITIASGTSSEGSLAFADGTSGADAYRGWINYNHNSNFLRFFTNAAERMRIDSSGRVGIGVTSPLNSVDINTGATSRVKTSDGTRELFAGVWASQPRIQGVAGTLDISANGAYDIAFSTNSTERVRIDSSGNLLVGTSSASARLQVIHSSASTPVALLQNTNTGSSGVGGVQTSIPSTANNTNCFHFKGTTQGVASYFLYGNGTSSFTSDERQKKNIVSTRDGYLDDLKRLRVVDYHWNNQEDTEDKSVGLIAQEVEQVFPHLVIEHEMEGVGPRKNLRGSEFTFVLIKAIQEQQAMIEELKAEVAALKGA